MFKRCRHEWDTVSCDFYRPTYGESEIRASGSGAHELIMKLTVGFTIVVQQCSSCRKVTTEEFLGRVVIPLENRVRST